MAQNNPFFGNPLDKVTDEIRSRRYELPDFSEVSTPSRAQGSGQGQQYESSGGLLPPPELEPLFLNSSREHQVPLNVLMAIGQQESSYNPNAIGPETQWGNAKGMMQYIDDTAAGMGIDPLDPAQAVDATARQFKDRLAQGYSVEEAVMAHFAGDDRRQWGPKTRQYARDVLSKAGSIREQWRPPEGSRVRGVTSDAIKAAEQVAGDTSIDKARADVEEAAGEDDRAASEKLDALREQAQDPDAVDALSGADRKIKEERPNTPLDLIRQGLSGASDFLSTPASEFDFLTRRAQGSDGGEQNDGPAGSGGGMLGDITGNIEEATSDPAEFSGERARDERDKNAVDAFTGAAPSVDDREWTGWAENLAKSVVGGAGGSVAASIEGVGLIGQQAENVEASNQLAEATKKFESARKSLARILEANQGEDDKVTVERAQKQAENLAQAEIEFHRELVNQAEREPDKVSAWLREKGVDLGELAQTMQADPEYQGVATDIAGGVGSMLTYLGPGFLSTLMSRGSTAAMRGVSGIAGASALAGPAGAAEAYQRANEYGFPEEEAVRIAMKGIPAGVVQVAPVATILKKIPQGIRGKAISQFRHILESFGAEFTAEGAGAVMQNLVEKSYDEDKGVWDDSLYQAAIGGSSAALITLGVQAATRGKGVGPLDAGDLGRELDKNVRRAEWNESPEMEALRVMDPGGYLDAIRSQAEKVDPEAVLAGDLSQAQGPAPEGPIERAAVETAGEAKVENVPGEHVSVETRTGRISGTVEDYYEDGQGAFQVQVLSDDGEMYVFDQDSQAVIIRDSVMGEGDAESDRGTDQAGPTDVPAMADVENREAPDEQPAEAVNQEVEEPAAPQVDAEYEARANTREEYLPQAETEQDVQDLIDAEVQDRAGMDTDRRNRFMAAANTRIAEINDESRARAIEEAAQKRESERQEQESAQAEVAETGEPIVEHMTRKGKIKRGVLRDIPLSEAKQIDEYAFRKQGKSFINLSRLDNETAAPAPQEAPEPTSAPDVQLKTDDTPFATYESAQRAMTNRRVKGRVVQVREGEWGIQPDQSTTVSSQKNETQSDVTAQYQDAIGSRIKSQKARMMRLRREPETPENKQKSAAAERRLRNLRQMAFNEAPEGWTPGDPIKVKDQSAKAAQAPSESRTPPIADARREDRKRELRQQGKETALASEPNEIPEWAAGDTELENAWGRGWNKGMVERAQNNAEARRKTEIPSDQGPHYAAGWKTATEGGDRELPSYFTSSRNKNAKDWKRGYDDANKKNAGPQASDNTVFTEDAAEKARALLRSKLGNLNAGVDPEVMQAGITLAGYHIEKGARTFAAYARAMVDDMGEGVKPYLKSWYMGVKYDPRAAGFDGLDDAGTVDAADVDAMLSDAQEADSAEAVADATELPAQSATYTALSEAVSSGSMSAADLIRIARIEADESMAPLFDRLDAHPSLADLTVEIDNTGRAAGRYSPSQHNFKLDEQFLEALAPGSSFSTSSGRSVESLFSETVAHELVHAVTAREIRQDTEAPGGGKFGKRLLRLQDDIRQFLDNPQAMESLSEQQRKELRTMADRKKGIYEIPTLALTSPSAKAALKMVRSRESASGWSQFVEAVRTLLKMPPGTRTLLDDLMIITDEIIQTGEREALQERRAEVSEGAEKATGEQRDYADRQIEHAERRAAEVESESREDAPNDTQGNSAGSAAPLVDTTPESNVPAEPGADPARVDGVRPASEAGNGQPESNRARREDGMERGQMAGVSGTADAGRSVDGSPDAGAGGGHRAPASDPLGRTADLPNTLKGENPGNFVIPDGFGLGQGTVGQKIKANLDALGVMKRANEEGRFATPDEQKTLARYVGWGGLAQVFDPKHRGKSNQYGRAYAWLKENLTEQEFDAASRSIQDAHYTSDKVVGMMWQAARHFGFKGGRAIEPTVGTGNFLGLEPADLAGATEWHASELDSVSGRIAQLLYPEANILAATGFQDAPFADGVMDLAIGNPPFGSQPIRDQSKRRGHLDGMKIHNYIIAKAGMHLRPGGVMQMVVTHRFLDTADTQGRAELAKHFRFLGAVRLPNDAFRATAGTDVTTDMVYLQKLRADEKPDNGASWLDTNGEIDVDGTKIRVNRYFQENPDNILGKSSMAGSMYRGQGQEYTVESDGRDIEASFNQILERGNLSSLAGVMTETPSDKGGKAVMLEQSDLPVGGMTLTAEGSIIQRDLDDSAGNAVINRITPESYWKEQAAQWGDVIDAAKAIKAAREDARPISAQDIQDFIDASGVATTAAGGRKPKPTKAEQAVYDLMDAVQSPNMAWTFDEGLAAMEATLERKRLGRKGYDTLRKLLDLRNRTHAVLRAERTDDPAMETLRKELDQAYDAFRDTYGLISEPGNLSLLSGDVGVEVGLEVGYKPEIKPAEARTMGVKPQKATATKADILQRRVTWPERVIESADNVVDGVNISLSERGKLDLAYIAGLVDKPQQAVIRELTEQEAIFYDPEQLDYVIADEYLSGNVKHKLEVARQEGAEDNIKALEAVQPEPKTKKQITPSIRGTWLPASMFENFLGALGVKAPKVLVQPSIGRISARESIGDATELGLQFSDPDATMTQMFNAASSGKSMKIMRRDGEGNTYEDKASSQRVTAKAERMAQVFTEWAYSDGERTDTVVDAYNRVMNTHRQREWNGEKYLKTVGQSPSVMLRRTQKNAAWRMIQSQNVLTDHVVGSGKTFTLITGIMERKRLGLSRKPVITVPNHLVVQWASEFYQLYPGARILAATPDDFAKKNRRRLFARMATGDYDAIIMGHSSFGFIEAPAKDVKGVIDANKRQLKTAMEEMKRSGESGRTLKQMEKKLDTYDDQLKALAERPVDQMGIDMEAMGVDYLAVDEAHMFKNLEYATSGERVVGMNDPKGSKRSFDLYAKVRGIQERQGGVAFATGTPVSNSLVELYTMMRYLAHDSLKQRDQDHFDAWAGAYAVTETRMEYTATQKLKPRRVLSGLANLDGLGQLYREFADIITMDDLKRIYAEEVRERNAKTGGNERAEFPVPKVKHGGRQLDTAQITQQQSEYMDYLVARMQMIEQKKSDPEYARIDNPLWVLSDARKMSLDIRVVDPTAERDESGKVMRSARKIKDLYDRWDADKGTQLVFSDLSTPSKTSAGAARKIVSDGLKVVFGESEARQAKKRLKDMSMVEQWKYVEDAAAQVMDDPAIAPEKVEKIEEFLEKNAFADSTMIVADTGFSVYDDLRNVLTEMGIPASEVAFIHDYNTPDQKSRLFARVNSGSIRVLIGSTEKMGAGTNAQERLVGLHHLDAPWRPSDVEQREGRIIRQGNVLYQRDPDGFEVEINAYSTNGTSDTVMWQVLERKAGAIEQFREAGLDAMEEDAADSDQYAEFMATSTGNPVFKLKLEAERDLTNTQAEVGGKLIAVQNARTFMDQYPDKTARLSGRIESLDAMNAGDIVYGDATGDAAGLTAAIEKAEQAFMDDYAAWQKKRDKAEVEREEARAAGKKKLPAIPQPPSRPGPLSASVVKESGYAQAVKSLLEDVGSGNKGDKRNVTATIGNVTVNAERVHNSEGEPYYYVTADIGEGGRTFLARSEARNPAESSVLAKALMPEKINSEIALASANAANALQNLEARLPREEGLAKQNVSDKPITDAQRLLDWYKDQVKIAEYEADVKRGERPNRYINAERRRPLQQFKAREEIDAKQFTVDGDTYTTTGLAAVEGQVTIHDATRDSDGRRAMVYEQKTGENEVNVTAFVEPDAARRQMRSATAQSNARQRIREPRMSVAEAEQRIRQGRNGEAASMLLDSRKVRVTDSTPGDVPNSTAAYVDEQGVINLVARNMDPEYAEATLLHEAFHAGTRPLIGGRRWNELQDRLKKLHNQAERSTGRNHQFWEAARARIAAAERAGDVMDEARRVEEFGAYALEEFDSAPRTLRQWASDMSGRVQAWLQRNFGIQVGEVSPAQLRALAAAALRNGDMAPSPAFDMASDQLVDAEGNPVPEAERRAEVGKAVRSARKALSVVSGDQGVRDADGGVTRDILKITALTHQPYTIASMEPQFTPVFRTAMAQMRFRDTIISEMYPRFRAYKELRQAGRAKVNQILELGRLTGMSFPDSRLQDGVENKGYKTVITYDAAGQIQRRREPLNTALSKQGDIIKLSKAEREAYSELRAMFDEALDLFRDQTLIDMDMAQFVGSSDPVADILNAIDGSMSDAMKERYQNIAKMVEEIEQAKRTGYVPLSRYGRFVITVKEKIADVTYAKNPEGGFIARGVPEALEDFMREIGAAYNDLEGGWQVSDGQRRQLNRETTRTVYSEKLDPEKYGDRWETWRASKNGKRPQQLDFIKQARARIESEWGGDNRTISVMDTKRAPADASLKLSDIDSLADLAQVDNETWNGIRDDFVKAMRGRGFRKHFFRAENVPGYELDFERAIADYMASMAGYLSRRHHEQQWEDSISGVKGPTLNKYAKEYREYVNNPAEEHAVLRQTGFLFYIAGNVSTALLNATQVPIMTMPALSQVMPHTKAARHVTGAYKDALAMTSMYDLSREGWQRGGVRGAADMALQMFDPKDAPADVRDEVQAAWDDGMFAPQFTHEVMGFSNRRDGSPQAKLEKTIDYVASSYTYIERLNRLVTFIAAVRAARDPKVQAKANSTLKGNALARMSLLGDNWSPKAFGEFIVDESQFMMGKTNRATMLRSHGAAVFQFMSFVINSLQAWYRWSTVNGRSGKMAAAYSIGAITALSGVWGAPGMDYLRKAIEGLWTTLVGEDEDLRYNLREWIGEQAGSDMLGEIADKGIFYPLGADMSGRIGFMRMLPDMTDPISMLGIPADLLIGRPTRAVQASLQGNYGGAVAELAPQFLKNPITAREWSRKGVVSRAGSQAITPEQLPRHAYWYKALGIQPSIVSDAWEYRYSRSRIERKYSTRTSRMVNKIARAEADASRNEDQSRQPELEARIERLYNEVDEFNMENPDHAIDPRSLIRRVNSKVNEYLYGLDQMGPVPSADVERAQEVYNIDDMLERGREENP